MGANYAEGSDPGRTADVEPRDIRKTEPLAKNDPLRSMKLIPAPDWSSVPFWSSEDVRNADEWGLCENCGTPRGRVETDGGRDVRCGIRCDLGFVPVDSDSRDLVREPADPALTGSTAPGASEAEREP